MDGLSLGMDGERDTSPCPRSGDYPAHRRGHQRSSALRDEQVWSVSVLALQSPVGFYNSYTKLDKTTAYEPKLGSFVEACSGRKRSEIRELRTRRPPDF